LPEGREYQSKCALPEPSVQRPDFSGLGSGWRLGKVAETDQIPSSSLTKKEKKKRYMYLSGLEHTIHCQSGGVANEPTFRKIFLTVDINPPENLENHENLRYFWKTSLIFNINLMPVIPVPDLRSEPLCKQPFKLASYLTKYLSAKKPIRGPVIKLREDSCNMIIFTQNYFPALG
jgi:hypothetical protein